MNPEQQNGQYQPAPTQQGQAPAPQVPQPGEPGHDPYGFIMDPQKPQKQPVKLLPSGNSMLQRIAIFGGGAVILIILIAIIAGMVGKSGQAGTDELITVAQEQTELARIATDGARNATSLATQNLANNVQITMTSAQNQTVQYLQNNHKKVGSKTLALKQSATTDTTLQNAKDAGTYDTTFTDIIQTDLKAYAQALTAAYHSKPGPKGEALLNAQYSAAKLLDAQSQQH